MRRREDALESACTASDSSRAVAGATARRKDLLLWLFPLTALLVPVRATPRPGLEDLKFLISLEQQAITAPFPGRVTLHLHNSGQESLWLYRRVRGQTDAGSTLAVRLTPAMELPSSAVPAKGRVLESAGLPRPRLVRLAPGEDYEEKATLHLVPALTEANGKQGPLWGRYRLSAAYQAKYANAEESSRILGLTMWQGEVTSNTLDLELLPPAASAQGSVAGAVTGSDARPIPDVLVSLSDQQERLLDQGVTDFEGRFSFTQLPFGLYWVTARRPNVHEDTAVFRHLEVTPAVPAGSVEMVLLPREIYEAKELLHKPVLLRVTDSAGRPLDKTTLEITWSNGTVLETVKRQTLEDGTATLELIPGRSYLTLKRRGCPSEEHRLDVSASDGIEAFKLVLRCQPK